MMTRGQESFPRAEADCYPSRYRAQTPDGHCIASRAGVSTMGARTPPHAPYPAFPGDLPSDGKGRIRKHRNRGRGPDRLHTLYRTNSARLSLPPADPRAALQASNGEPLQQDPGETDNRYRLGSSPSINWRFK